MTGDQIAAYLNRTYRLLLAEVVPVDDAAALCGDAARMALILVGVLTDTTPYAAAVTTTIAQEQDVLALGRYELLRLLCDQFVVAVDVQSAMPQVALKRSQMHDHALLMLADAEMEIANRGYGKSAAAYGRLQLDILEPIQGYGLGPWFNDS